MGPTAKVGSRPRGGEVGVGLPHAKKINIGTRKGTAFTWLNTQPPLTVILGRAILVLVGCNQFKQVMTGNYSNHLLIAHYRQTVHLPSQHQFGQFSNRGIILDS